MKNYRDFKQSEAAIAAFAFRVHQRLYSAGDHSTSIEDLKQELVIAWCEAVERFDPEQGVPFLAYLRNGMRMYINRFVAINLDRRHEEVTALSLDYTVEGDDGDMSFGDAIPSAEPTQGEILESNDSYQRTLALLSPRARKFVSILHDQPEDLLQQVFQMESRAEHARSMGVVVPHSNRLTKEMVFALMGANGHERTKIVREIQNVVAALAAL